MKIKACFDKNDQLLAVMQVVEEEDIDFVIEGDEQQDYELEVADDFFEKGYSAEDEEREIKRLRT